MISWIFAILTIIRPIVGTLVNNGVVGVPFVRCSGLQVELNITTQKAFEGHVYVRGHYDAPGCRIDASNSLTTIFTVRFATCGVIRRRSANPNGVYMTTVVIVSFHPMFLTKVDKSYFVQCFYTAIDRVVSTDLNVRHHEIGLDGMGINDASREAPFNALDEKFTTRLITQNVPMPVCRYEVFPYGKHDGQTVRYAVVGQPVFHKWTCDSDLGYFCMTVHSCLADDGNGKSFSLLDKLGCARDRYLMNNLRYSGDLSGGVASQVFKYADKPTLFFQCQVRLFAKDNGKCERSSDKCHVLARDKRNIKERNVAEDLALKNIDVVSDIMIVIGHENSPALLENGTDYVIGPPLVQSTRICLPIVILSRTCVVLLFVSALVLGIRVYVVARRTFIL